MEYIPYAIAGLLGFVVFSVFFYWLTTLRIVVPTNSVDIVQSARRTVSYGKDQSAGNVYYKWPDWIPRFGIKVISLPVSVFRLNLKDYPGYDVGRVPFVIDILAFFRISDSNVAAQRVSSFQELEDQLTGILQGAARTILATSEIEQILQDRGIFGTKFTEEVEHQLTQWGVTAVKNIELMDIRDAKDSEVIANIMAKKKSLIEMQSRVEVASNVQKAEVAEIDAAQTVKVRAQEAEREIGLATAQKTETVGIRDQQAIQAIKESEKDTATKTMAVVQVNEVRKAEIARDVALVAAEQAKKVAVVAAEQDRDVAVTEAEGYKTSTQTKAEGDLEKARRDATGIQVKGEAEGAAQQAVLMAPVTAQITLAKEIGENASYQNYLVTIKTVEAGQAVGIAQAAALEKADVKVISNAGTPPQGLTGVMDLFTPKGANILSSALETFKATPTGSALINKITGNGAGTGDGVSTTDSWTK